MARPKPKQLHPNAIHLTVVSVMRAARFYEEKLGFKMVESFPDAQKPVWANLVLGGQSVMLGELPSLQQARELGMDRAEIELLKQDARSIARGQVGVGASYFVRVDDVDAFARRLKRRRIKPLTPPKTQFYGLRECQVTDPDGYRLVFFSQVASQAAPAVGGNVRVPGARQALLFGRHK
ncbi:MAG: VOC family protein [Planctomycetota bacterium]